MANELERENRELRQANEILRKGEPVKAPLVQAHWRTRLFHRRSSTARFANYCFPWEKPRCPRRSEGPEIDPRHQFPDGRQSARRCSLPLLPIMTGAPSRAILIGHRWGKVRCRTEPQDRPGLGRQHRHRKGSMAGCPPTATGSREDAQVFQTSPAHHFHD